MIEFSDMNVAGFLPDFFSEDDPRPAAEQLDENYQHGGGWRPMKGWDLVGGKVVYPGDPPLEPVSEAALRGEKLTLFQYDFLLIQQGDGSFEVGRVD